MLMKRPVSWLFAAFFCLQTLNAAAIETLSAKELASYCKHYETDDASLEGKYCAHYIRGFIDGAIATDARVMINIEEELNRKESFHERVMRTRAPSRDEYRRAARYAEFCLGDPVMLREVVGHVVAYFSANHSIGAKTLKLDATISARDFVYMALKKHYPCNPK